MQAIQSAPRDVSTGYADAPTATVDGGDLGAELAALAVQNGDSERTAAHDERSLDEAAQESADDAQVQAMHDEASSLRTQGWVDAGVGVASAAVAFAAPAAAAASGASGATSSAAATASSTSDAWSKIGTAAPHLIDAGGRLADGFFKAGQNDDQARATSAKAAADREANDAKDASDQAADANGDISAALEFARSYVATEGATQSAALHRA